MSFAATAIPIEQPPSFLGVQHSLTGKLWREHLGQLVALGDRERARRAARVEPVAPQLSGQRMLHAEKRRRLFDRDGCGGKRHDDARR